MKIFVACVLLAVVLAEPPVDNRYLPPQQGLSPPSQSYGFPGFGGQRQTDAFLRPRPSYGAPAVNQRPSGRRPSNQYIPPQSLSNQYGPPRNQYLPPSNQYAAPRNQYIPPSNRNSPPSNQYIPPSNQYAPPSNQYIPPSNRNAPPSNQYIPPSNQYAPPSNQYIPPSNQYIPPPNRAEPFETYNGGPDSVETRNSPYSAENLYPKADTRGIEGFRELNEAAANGPYPQRGGYAGDDEGNNKPANYNFEYKVKDEPSGNDFGHRESRQGNRANGLYYVVLPDGRKQMVEYVADEEGYKPKISYEDVGAYANNARNGFEADGPY